MKSRVWIVMGLCLVSVLSLGLLSRAQAPANQLYGIGEFVVEPAKAADFEAAMKGWVPFYVKNNYPWPYTVYRTEDFHYYLLGPVKDMAAFGEMMKTDMEIAQKGGMEFESLMKKAYGSTAYLNYLVAVLRNDLSYAPEKPRVTVADSRFICWDYYYGIPGKENEAEQIAKEWQALYKGKNIPDGFQVYMIVMGYDMPATVAARWGKSQADFNAEDESVSKTLGDAYTELAAKTMALCRKYERRFGYRLDALSYSPAVK